MPPTVLFDIDGTLVRYQGVGRTAMARAMQEVWGISNALAGVSFAGATDGGVARRVAPDQPREPMWQRYVELLDEALDALPDKRPLPGVVALLDALDEAGVRAALLTGNISAGARSKLRAVDLWERFDLGASAFAEDGEERERIARIAIERAGTRTVIVGDTRADIRAARHVGVPVLATATGAHDHDTLARDEPDLLTGDLSDTNALRDWLLRCLSD